MSTGGASPARLVALAAVGLAVAAGAGWLVFRLLFGGPVDARPPTKPAPAPVHAAAVRDAGPAERRVEAAVTAVSGVAERAHGGEWTRLQAGDALGIDETVRTGPDGRVELVVGDEQSRITVSDRTQVTVAELSAAVHRFKLTTGRLAVDYREAERVLKIEAENAGGIATTKGARFAVLASGTTVAVATESGAVALTSDAGSVEVTEGKQSVVGGPAKAPSAPAPIPVDVLLKVAARAKAEACATLVGTVQPGSALEVDGKPVDVKPNGAFEVAVTAAPGKKQVTVTARDALGRERQQLVACAAADEGPSNVEIQWGK